MRCDGARRLLGPVSVFVGLILGGCQRPGAQINEVEAGSAFADRGIYRILVLALVEDDKKQQVLLPSFGTGFLIGQDDIVVTNRHVIAAVAGARSQSIKIGHVSRGQFEFVDAEVVRPLPSGESEDLAFLKSAKPLTGLPATFADYRPVLGGEVRAVGYPSAADADLVGRLHGAVQDDQAITRSTSQAERIKALAERYLREHENQYRNNPAQFASTQTQGIVSRLSPSADKVPVVQHQAPINPGNSGGPLFDACGNVIGINTFRPAASAQTQGIFMALGSDWIVERARAQGYEIRTAGKCLAATVQSYLPTSVNGAAALPAVAALALSLLTMVMLFAFRKSVPVQRGLSILSLPEWHGRARRAGGWDASGPGSVIRLVPIGTGRMLTLPMDRLSQGVRVGRDAGSDMHIEQASVSKSHARLTYRRGRMLVEDLGSTNGTWKGDRQIARALLLRGDVIRFGNVEFRVELPGGSGAGSADRAGPAMQDIPSRSATRDLLLSGQDEQGRLLQFDLPVTSERTWLIGRRAEAVDLAIDHPRVSAEHARIRFRPEHGFEIYDAGSTNGTRVDGVAVARAYVPLAAARKVSFGDFEMTVEWL